MGKYTLFLSITIVVACQGHSSRNLLYFADRLSPFKFYQFLLTTTTDKDVIKFLRMLTFISLEDIESLEKEMSSSDYRPNTAQKILAREVTQFVHGSEGLKQAEAATQVQLRQLRS